MATDDNLPRLDPGNTRHHSRKSIEAIKASLNYFGAGRSVVVDAEGIVRAGNGTIQAAGELGLKTRVIETDGTELVVLKRTDLSGSRATAYSIADNRSAEMSEWDALALVDAVAEVQSDQDLSSMGDFGIDLLTFHESLAASESVGEVSVTASVQQPKDRFSILVDCESETQQRELLEQLEKKGIQCRALIV